MAFHDGLCVRIVVLEMINDVLDGNIIPVWRLLRKANVYYREIVCGFANLRRAINDASPLYAALDDVVLECVLE